MSIKHLLYVERDVGGTIKRHYCINNYISSKKQFIWEFELDGKQQKIELYDSKWSGKKTIIKNGRVECEVSDQASFFRSFDLNGHNCTIIQYGEKNELRIDNQSFSHLYNLERNKTFFSENSGPTSKSMQSKSLPLSKANQYGISNNFYGNNAPKDDKPPLFSFSIKPVDHSHQPQKQFQFKSDISSSSCSPSQQQQHQQNTNHPQEINLLGIDDMSNQPIPDKVYNIVEESKSNSNDLFDVFGNNNTITTTTTPMMNNNNINTNANIYNGYTQQKNQFDDNGLKDIFDPQFNNNVNDKQNSYQLQPQTQTMPMGVSNEIGNM